MQTPDEIKRYQKIISNKDAILEDAQTKADAIIAEAQAQAQKIVSESEVMQVALQQSNQLIEQTNAQAQEIMDKATEDSNSIRMSAISYTDEMLENLEKIMSHTIDTAGSKYNNFINSIQSCYDIVSKNRSELSPQASPSSYTAPTETEEEEAE
jgi:F0F1-type ATP synthase membrane subunit b/b'